MAWPGTLEDGEEDGVDGVGAGATGGRIQTGLGRLMVWSLGGESASVSVHVTQRSRLACSGDGRVGGARVVDSAPSALGLAHARAIT